MIQSEPARFPTTRRSSNEPLGPRVTRVVRTSNVAGRLSVTVQRTPFRFWSTSNSTSMRPSSSLSLSLLELGPVQAPRTRTSPSFADVAGIATSAAAAATDAGTRRFNGVRLISPPPSPLRLKEKPGLRPLAGSCGRACALTVARRDRAADGLARAGEALPEHVGER